MKKEIDNLVFKEVLDFLEFISERADTYGHIFVKDSLIAKQVQNDAGVLIKMLKGEISPEKVL